MSGTAATALPFGVDAGSFALSAGLLATLPRRPRASVIQPPVGASIAEGVRWLGRHRLLRTLAGLLAVNTFCSNVFIFASIGISPNAVTLGVLLG